MAMYGTAKIILVLLSLASPIAAFTEYYYGPTLRPQPRPIIRSASPTNQYPESFNSTLIPSDTEARSTNNRPHVDETPIVYPETRSQQNCAFGLCVNVANYPKEQIQKLLSRSQTMNGYFEVSEESVSIVNRFNTDEMSLCETKVHTIYPEKANNTMKIEKVIVNVEGHKQGVVFETCVDNGKCKFSSNFPSGYTSYCKQKYIHKRLMVLGDNDKFVFDSFEVPSCCVCTVSRTD